MGWARRLSQSELAGGTAVPGGFLEVETFQAAVAPVLWLLSGTSSGSSPSQPPSRIPASRCFGHSFSVAGGLCFSQLTPSGLCHSTIKCSQDIVWWVFFCLLFFPLIGNQITFT